MSIAFEYKLHPELKLEKGNWGKCIIYNVGGDSNIYFSVSKIPYVIPSSTEPRDLKNLFNTDWFSMSLAGLHRDIPRIGSKESRITLGGGAYMMIDNNIMFVDNESGDFGKMNRSLLSLILSKKDIALLTLGDKYFYNDSLELYLQKMKLIPTASEEDVPFNDFDIPFEEDEEAINFDEINPVLKEWDDEDMHDY